MVGSSRRATVEKLNRKAYETRSFHSLSREFSTVGILINRTKRLFNFDESSSRRKREKEKKEKEKKGFGGGTLSSGTLRLPPRRFLGISTPSSTQPFFPPPCQLYFRAEKRRG